MLATNYLDNHGPFPLGLLERKNLLMSLVSFGNDEVREVWVSQSSGRELDLP